MTRFLLAGAALAALGPVAFAGIVFVPRPLVPRELFAAPDTPPDGERDPAKLAERVARNVRTAGDNLKAKDAGPTTHKAQSDALRDIDELLKQADNPPPPPMSGGNPPPMPPPMGGGDEGDTPPPMPMGGQEPGKGQPMGGQPMPGGAQPMDNGAKPMPGDGQPMPMGRQEPGKGQPMGDKPGDKPGSKRPSWRDKAESDGDPAGPMPPMPMGEPKGASPGKGKPGTGQPGGGGGTAPSTPAPPAEDAVAKQVWGHLPERLRQEMNQYYKEQFMPKYGDLLRQYYGTLAEREAGPRK